MEREKVRPFATLILLFIVACLVLLLFFVFYGQSVSEGAEEPSVEYLSREKLLRHKDCACFHIYSRGTPSSLDGNGEAWSGLFHDSGIFPGLGETESGFVKTVMRDPKNRGRYRVIYIHRPELTWDYRVTEIYRRTGVYDVESEVPELCPNPTRVVYATR